MFGHVSPAEAARSAGRVGGFAGSSAPSRSYGGGGGYSGGGGGYSRGGSYAPSYGGSYVSPPSFYRGGYSSYGLMGPPVVAPPVVVAPYATGAAVVASPASPVLDALLLMSLAFIAFSAASSALAPGRSGGLLGPDAGAAGSLQLTKIQVGLLAVARDLKRDLDQIAEDADTSSNAGLKELLQEVTLALLRNPQYAEFVSGGKRAVGDSSELERLFNRCAGARGALVSCRGDLGQHLHVSPGKAGRADAAAADAAAWARCLLMLPRRRSRVHRPPPVSIPPTSPACPAATTQRLPGRAQQVHRGDSCQRPRRRRRAPRAQERPRRPLRAPRRAHRGDAAGGDPG
jgi:hypothetical protein